MRYSTPSPPRVQQARHFSIQQYANCTCPVIIIQNYWKFRERFLPYKLPISDIELLCVGKIRSSPPEANPFSSHFALLVPVWPVSILDYSCCCVCFFGACCHEMFQATCSIMNLQNCHEMFRVTCPIMLFKITFKTNKKNIWDSLLKQQKQQKWFTLGKFFKTSHAWHYSSWKIALSLLLSRSRSVVTTNESSFGKGNFPWYLHTHSV